MSSTPRNMGEMGLIKMGILSHFRPIFLPFSSPCLRFFSHSGSCSCTFHPDPLMIPHFPLILPHCSPFPPFPPSFRTPKFRFGEVLSSAAGIADA